MTDQSESLFWDKYISKTKAYRIKSTAARWYVRHAERYIKAHANLRLAQHSASQMEKYIREKGRNSYLEGWQFKQTIVALKILFVEMVKAPWARNFVWDDWLAAADSLANSHATVTRDYQEGGLSCTTPFFRDPSCWSEALADFCSCKIGIHYIHVDNIRTVQELLGHADVSTTMIYTHVLNKPGVIVTSPLDLLDR